MNWGCAFHGPGLVGYASRRLMLDGTRVTGKPRKKQNFGCDGGKAMVAMEKHRSS